MYDRQRMASFATEFPIKPIADRRAFVAQVVGWLSGASYSTVLNKPSNTDLEGDTAHLRSQDGEELRLREFAPEGKLEAIGFRHDFPDVEGRLWRTEVVLRRSASTDGQDLVRLRTECIARTPSARLDSPRKPFLIKMILQDQWGGKDGEFRISEEPYRLPDDEVGLKVASEITFGKATRYLPVIYVSAIDNSNWLLSEDEIKKLAFDLGGIAHVVLEPSRAFSFRLRDFTAGTNAYGGTLAIALPVRGTVRRLFLGVRFPSVDELLAGVREASVGFRSQMPAEGWDWTELQEQALRWQRQRDRNRLSAKDAEELFQAEIDNLQDRIGQLEAQLAARALDESTEVEDGSFASALVKAIGPEIYPGEISDRLRLAAKDCAARADQIGLDRRSKVVFDAVVAHLPLSPALSELLEDLKRATKDSKRLASALTALLIRHGYREKSDNKHIRLEARNGYDGLETITLPVTPSDSRGLTNVRKQIERTLGIAKLST
jgi:hypothetical protein